MAEFAELKRDPAIDRSGFTLFELLVVMAMIAILSALVLPRIGGNRSRLHLTVAAKDVASLMRYARNQAVAGGIDISVVYEISENRIGVLAAETENEASEEDSFSVGMIPERVYSLPETISPDPSLFEGKTFDNRIRLALFYALGNSSGGSVLLRDDREYKLEIRIDPITGAVRVVEEN